MGRKKPEQRAASEEHRTSEGPVPKSVDEYLLEPRAFLCLSRARAGDSLTSKGASTLAVGWPKETIDELIAWLQTGDMERLAALLRSHPFIIGHPVVFTQLLHLERMRWSLEPENYAQGACLVIREGREPDVYDNPPSGTGRAARETLQKFVRAWVQGILPGWTIEPVKFPRPRGQRGRPRKLPPMEDEMLLLEEANEMYEQLKSYDAVSPHRRESRRRLTQRAVYLVQKLHLSSWRSLTGNEPVPGEPAYDESGWPNSRIKFQRLPTEVAQQIGGAAVGHTSISKNKLIWGLFAHYLYTTPGSIKGHLQRAEEAHPELDHHRHKPRRR